MRISEDLIKRMRRAGLTVHEESGWRTRGLSSFGPIVGITIHETRGSLTSTDRGEINVIIRGSKTAPPPISHFYLSRSGEWWIVTSGLAYHNKIGWAGPNEGFGNKSLIGIEAQHAKDERWTGGQYGSYVIGTSVIADFYKIPNGRIAGHKEHQPGGYGHSSVKSDPGFDMGMFRQDVANYREGEVDMFLVTLPGEIWVSDGQTRRRLADTATANRLREIGVREVAVKTQTELDRVAGPILGRHVWMGHQADVIDLWPGRSTEDNKEAQSGWVLSAIGQWVEGIHSKIPAIESALQDIKGRPDTSMNYEKLGEEIAKHLPPGSSSPVETARALASVLTMGTASVPPPLPQE